MPILFSAVARDNKFSSDFASCDGNFTEIAHEVLSKIPPRDHKMTYSHGSYLFHYIAQDKYFYFCITDKTCQRSRAFLFLNEIQRRFKRKFKENFKTILAEEMYRYSEDYNTITIRQGELDELNAIGVGTSESILGEKILYVTNIDNLSYSSTSNVGKTPEHVSISVQYPGINVVFLSMFIFIAGSSVYIFGPISCLIISLIIAFSFIRTMIYCKNKSD